jgi:hypothetical protein
MMSRVLSSVTLISVKRINSASLLEISKSPGQWNPALKFNVSYVKFEIITERLWRVLHQGLTPYSLVALYQYFLTALFKARELWEQASNKKQMALFLNPEDEDSSFPSISTWWHYSSIFTSQLSVKSSQVFMLFRPREMNFGWIKDGVALEFRGDS